MNVKRKDLLTIWAVLESLKNSKTNIRTTYNIAKNRNLCQPEIEAIQAAVKLDGPLEAYERQRIDICKKYAKKDEDGEPLIDNGSFLFEANVRADFEKELLALQVAMPEAMDQAKVQEHQIESLLNGEVAVEFIPFSLCMLPDDLMSVAQIEALDKYGLITE